MKKSIFSLTILLSTLSFAHFQMISTSNFAIDSSAKNVKLDMLFTHPAENGFSMDIGKNIKGEIKPVEAFLLKKGDTVINAKDKLIKTKFGKKDNKALAYTYDFNFKEGLRPGAWTVIFVPAPYFEKSEDGYIKQATKVYIKKGDTESDEWQERQMPKGEPEIIPHIDPTNVWKNQVFTAKVVDENGNPAKNKRVEVEFKNYDIKNGMFVGKPKTEHSTAVILTDDNGMFSFVPTEKGQWGFSAIDAATKKTLDGKEVEHDAVLWIEVQK